MPGSAALRSSLSSPARSSRLISSPTTKKKTTMRHVVDQEIDVAFERESPDAKSERRVKEVS